MQVWIKSFKVNMEVKANGIEFEVRSADGKTQLGDCRLTMTGLVWCPGKVTKPNGIKVLWKDFLMIMKSKASLEAAIKAAKNI